MWAVEARIFDNGKIVARIREAKPGEKDSCLETRRCDIWVTIFEDKREADRFCQDYRNA